VFVELLLRHWPAPVLTAAWEIQKDQRLQQLVQQRGAGDSIAAGKEILFGALLSHLRVSSGGV